MHTLRFSRVVLALAAGCTMALAKPARLVPYEPEFYRISEAVRTPHTPWAKPLPGSRLRVLCIVPWGCQRHVVELAQRLDMDYEVFFTTRRYGLGYLDENVKSWAWVEGLFQEEREEALHRVLPGNWDAYVVGCEWSALPLWARHDIARAVHAGAGLLIGYRQGEPYLNRMLGVAPVADSGDLWTGLPLADFANLGSFDAANPLAARGDFGEGRVAMLRYPVGGSSRECFTPNETVPASELDYDIYQALAIRTLLWTARREFPLQPEAASPAVWNVGEPPETLAVSVYVGKPLWRAVAEVVWRDREGRVLARTEAMQRIPEGQSQVSLPVPVLPTGRAYACLRVLADGKVAGFACLPVDVLAAVDLAAIRLDQAFYAADVPLTAAVELTGPAPAGAVLDQRVTNAFGYVVARQSLPVPAGAATLPMSLAMPPPLCVWHELEVGLRIGERVAAVRRAEVFREWRRPADQFSLVAWYGPSNESYYDRLVNQAFRAAGVDTVYPSHVWGETAARRSVESVRAGLTVLPYIGDLRTPGNANPPPNQREPAVTDPVYQAQLVGQIRTTVQGFRPLHPTGYSLGDENYFGGSAGNELCTAPASVAYFRNWLEKRYGTIAALNAAWHTEFADFAAVEPVLLAAARQQGNPAPWLDFRLAMEQSWTDIFALLAREIRSLDPGGIIGHEGSGSLSSFGGFDWWSMLRELDLFVPYPERHSGGNLVRSFRNPGTMASYWYGAYTFSCGGRRPSTMRYFPWYSLFQGFNSAWYFNTVGHANMAHEVGFAADLRPLPHFAATAAACAEIKTGFDRLLLGSARAHDGIAIFYSPLAIHANTFYNRPFSVEQEFHGMAELLNDLGFQYDFVSSAQLTDGTFAKGGYRLLILAMAEAMTAEEAAAVRAFHAAGGAVLADLPPAIEDQHGRPWSPQPLADLFGIQPAGSELVCSRQEMDGAAGNRVAVYTVNGAIPPAGSRVFLANADWGRYSALRRTPAGADMRRRYADEVIGSRGIAPVVRVLSPEGEPMPGMQSFRFVKGTAQFVGILPEDFHAVEERLWPAELAFPEGHLYDLRRGRYLGRRGSLRRDLRTCDPELFAILPYLVSGLHAESPATEDTPLGQRVTWRGRVLAAGGDAGDQHVVRIDLKSPAGELLLPYRRTVWTQGGVFESSVILPLDAAPGRWALEATDVISGMQAHAWLEVK